VKRFAIVIACLVTPGVALAQVDQKPATPPPSAYDRVWSHLTNWYANDENPAVQRVLFTGRFQHDLAIVDADRGDHDESNVRRLRFGPRITFARDYLFHLEVEVNPQEHNPFYMRITDLYVAWQKHPKAVIQAGKQSVPFTQEGATSSKELLTIDRSNLANNIWFTQEYMPGISVSGRISPWHYRAGVYSSGAMNRELGEFNGGQFALFVAGYDFAKRMHVKEATLTGNYLYQHPDINNTFTKRWEHVGSLHFKLEQPKWGVRSDLSTTAGYLGQSNVLGVMVMPSYNITNKLQAVARFTRLDSDTDNGLVLNTYENRIVTGRGDEYQETYLGFNYFIYGHKLKVQTGVQFAEMKDAANDGGAFSGTSWTTGLRIGW
jgi:phosphate-selective porin OprO/OprP